MSDRTSDPRQIPFALIIIRTLLAFVGAVMAVLGFWAAFGMAAGVGTAGVLTFLFALAPADR